MVRYQILIEYVGTNFKGWQIQKKGATVQGTIQNKLSKLLKQKIILIGSGRTDAGVHAFEQSAHFECKDKINDTLKFIKSINYFLNDKDIVITKIKKKTSKFHARFSAKKRIYKYIILNRISSSTIEKKRVWHVRGKLNLDLMQKGAKKLIGTKDFSTFRAASCNAKTPIRTIDMIKIKNSNSKIEIQIKSQSFLQQQVRSIVGCLKYLGENKWTLKKFDQVVKSKKRSFCAPPAPPEGLFLSKVIY